MHSILTCDSAESLQAEFDVYTSENSTARFTIVPACATSIMGFQGIWGDLLEPYRFVFSDNQIVSGEKAFL
jgi:hypothetical protein